MKKILSAILVIILAGLAGPARGADTFATLKAGYVHPSDAIFREVYGGGLAFGAEVAVPLAGPIHLWAGAEYFGKTGRLSVSGEETKVRIIPLYAGLRAQFGQKGARPYFGAAASYFLLHEENPLGTADKGGLGLITQAGVLARLAGPLWLDLHAGYRIGTVRTDDAEPLEAKLDGFYGGLGLSFRF